MKTTAALALLALLLLYTSSAHADIFGSGANEFTIEFVPIGNPGNLADITGDPNPAGSVDYAYRMGKYAISRDMITKANNEGGLGITMHDMSFVIGGARDDMPATGVTWFEAARFVNWLNTNQGHQAAYNFDGSGNFGLWSSAEAWQAGGENLFRHKDAFYFLPSVDEWYKAAYYDPNANGGAGGYWNYPTGSNTAPTPVASGTAAYTAVYGSTSQGPADITLAGGLSPYGTMGQGGNAGELEEGDMVIGTAARGGNWFFDSDEMLASSRYVILPSFELFFVGFRVASIPEPGTVLMGALASVGMMLWRRR